jgi:outer membrane lipoprotein-sorting protein
MLFGLIVTSRMTSPTAAASWQQPQGEKTVEQTRKNIQVLKGLPESQLFPLMNFVATSLGVKCDSCHVKKGEKYYGGDWAWESDEKPKKLIGRQMMKMVLDINATNFDRKTSVTCFTCHRGSTHIARVPPLPPHDPPVSTETSLPTAEQILTKYAAAVGGKDAAAKFKTTVMKGAIERSEGRNAQLEVTLKDTDKYLITQTSPQGVNVMVVNGAGAMVKSGPNSRALSGRPLEQSRRTAAVYYSPIKVVEQPAQLRVLGTEKIGDREAYVLALSVDPDTTRRFFFDTQTGLLLRELTTTRSMLAPLPDQIDFEDYRDVDGIKLPFIIRTSDTATYSTATRRFTEIKHNVTVNDDVFNLTAAPPQ